MESPRLLVDFAVALLAALVAGVACIRLRQPVLVGYLLAGIVIGPHGLGWIHDKAIIQQLSDLGVILLMFALGVEFSLAQFRPLRSLVLVGGGAFILACVATAALGFHALGVPWTQGVLFGCMAALSSTIIVMRVLIDKHAVDSVHGKAMLGWLILQDLAVVPMLVTLPYLAAGSAFRPWPLALALCKVLIFLAVMYLAGAQIFPRILARLARMRQKEIFFLGVIALCLGTAALSAWCGLSLALGAFLAGLAIGQSDEHHQVLAEVLPIRDIFVTLFFVSIGMLLDPGFMATHALALVALVAAIIAGKTVLGTAIALALRLSPRASLLIGLGLAQIGEFSFVLAKEGRSLGLIGPSQFSLALAAALATMLLTPALMRAASPLSAFAARFYRGRPGVLTVEPEEPAMRDHVIIVGYGRVGQQLGRILHAQQVPFLVVDLDRTLLRNLKARGYHTLFGDGAMREVLDHAGLAGARLLVVALPDPGAARLVVAQACKARPGLEVIAIAQRRMDARAFEALGACEVVQADFEAGVALLRAALVRLGWPPVIIHGYLGRLRQRAAMDPFEEQELPDAARLDELTRPPPGCEASWLNVTAGCALAGQGLEATRLRERTGLTVLALRRGQSHILHPGARHILQTGDALLVLGTSDQLQAALGILQPATTVARL
ncbi:MAG: Kef-type potassium/proton antiporter, family [Cyanobacteria bacterium RYN_339]|nr:Kef-type potassium/proton antiporter, family [Cyanobacteria bacterium RYN_339]